MVYVRSPILIGDNQRKYSSHQPWIHGTSLMWALHVWSCVTDFSSLTALLGYLVTCKIRAHSPSPDGRYQIICNFVRTCYEPLDYANFIFDRCVAARLCQQTRFIVPVESAGANRVPIVPEDSGSHRHRETFKQKSRRRWFETPLLLLWRHCNELDKIKRILQIWLRFTELNGCVLCT